MRLDWVRLPTAWIETGGLTRYKWGKDGSTRVAAFLLLIVIAQNAEQLTGAARLTYDQFNEATGLSRLKIANGLALLIRRKVIERAADLGQSGYRLCDFDPAADWGKLPARQLYSGGAVPAFTAFTLRSRTELDALKIYLLFVARRNRNTNLINLTYDSIESYAGIDRNRIRSALSRLAAANLVHVDHAKRPQGNDGYVNVYRLVHVDPYRHLGSGATLEPMTGGLGFSDL